MIKRRSHKVIVAGIVVVLGTVAGGFIFDRLLNTADQTMTDEDLSAREGTQRDAFGEHFHAAAQLLAAQKYMEAIEMLEMAQRIKPHVPEVYVNLGFAYLGQQQPQKASQAFNKALSIKTHQLNAYYGLAEALEALGDLEGALGAIRTYVHLSQEDDPFRRKAMSAAWEWQEALNEQKRDRAQASAIEPVSERGPEFDLKSDLEPDTSPETEPVGGAK